VKIQNSQDKKQKHQKIKQSNFINYQGVNHQPGPG
jgi:hypothetical protein